jgi:hypothetical protein
MIAELAFVTGLGVAAAFKKGPLRKPEKGPLENNLISPEGDGGVARCVLAWERNSKVPDDEKAKIEYETVVFPLDYNPTKFRITRAPYFGASKGAADARLGAKNVAYGHGAPYVHLDFVLDNTECSDEGGPKEPTADGDAQRRVYHQMRVLHSMLEPEEYIAKMHLKRPKKFETTKLDAKAFATSFPPKDQALFRKSKSHQRRDRQPKGIWMVWGPLEFLGAVHDLRMNVTAVDGHGNPRRVEVYLRMKGDLFREEEFYKKYIKTPGGDNTGNELHPPARN